MRGIREQEIWWALTCRPLHPSPLHSFARWWEGRIIWGQIVNFARNYSRLVLEWAPEDKRHVASAAIRWAIAAPHVLRYGHGNPRAQERCPMSSGTVTGTYVLRNGAPCAQGW